jgi:hypothetical protein
MMSEHRLLKFGFKKQTGLTKHGSMRPSSASTMVSQHVLDLCTSSTTLIAELAKNPDQPVSRVTKRLFKNHGARFKQLKGASPAENERDELDTVTRCGSFPSRPSDLFLQVSYYRIIFSMDSCDLFDRSTAMPCMH